MTIDIDIQFATLEKCPTSDQIKMWINAVLKKKNAKVVIRIVNEDEMIILNRQYRHKEKPTNVLSFPCQLPSKIRGNILGDIVICASVVANEANEQNKPFTAHWAHMVVHGVLHLLGYDHENEEDAVKMESLEIAILNDLGFSDPYGVKLNHE